MSFQKVISLFLLISFSTTFSYAEDISTKESVSADCPKESIPSFQTSKIDEQFDEKHNLKKCDLKAKWVSEEDEIQFGHYVDAYLTNQFIVLKDSPVCCAVKEIGEHVAKLSDRPKLQYGFKVLNTPDVNAFAGPGGYIYITTGLLDILETKDEVAAILGHEIGHVCERHSIRTLQSAQNTNMIGGLLAVTAAVATAVLTYDSNTGTYSPDLSSLAGQVAFMSAVIVHQGYSRAYENTADELGIEYIYKAGYDPEGAAGALDKLLNVEKDRKDKVKYTLLSTHPPIESRIRRVKEIIEKLK